MKKRRKGQASLETLLIAGALLAFLAAFVPFIIQTRDFSKYGEAVVQEKLFVSTVAEDARRARLLGEGNSFSREFFLPAERTEVYFDETRQALELVFVESGRQSSFEERLGFNVVLEKRVFGKQKIYSLVRNEAGEITISLWT